MNKSSPWMNRADFQKLLCHMNSKACMSLQRESVFFRSSSLQEKMSVLKDSANPGCSMSMFFLFGIPAQATQSTTGSYEKHSWAVIFTPCDNKISVKRSTRKVLAALYSLKYGTNIFRFFSTVDKENIS